MCFNKWQWAYVYFLGKCLLISSPHFSWNCSILFLTFVSAWCISDISVPLFWYIGHNYFLSFLSFGLFILAQDFLTWNNFLIVIMWLHFLTLILMFFASRAKSIFWRFLFTFSSIYLMDSFQPLGNEYVNLSKNRKSTTISVRASTYLHLLIPRPQNINRKWYFISW